jgi:hypothetical protein
MNRVRHYDVVGGATYLYSGASLAAGLGPEAPAQRAFHRGTRPYSASSCLAPGAGRGQRRAGESRATASVSQEPQLLSCSAY